MKQVYFFVLFLFFSFWLVGQCPTGDIRFSRQSQVDSFLIEYPDCTELSDSVHIEGNIENLNGLSNIILIKDHLVIANNPNLNNLEGLENLLSIGGNFYLYSNNLVINFEDLKNLKSIGGDFWGNVYGVEKNFEGLRSLEFIGGELRVPNDLMSFEGLENLKSIGSLFMWNDDSIKSFKGLESLKSIKGLINILRSSLINFEGLENVDTIGSFLVRENNSLVNFQGLGNVKHTSNFHIDNNISLENFKGLESLSSISGSFNISDNSSLENFQGLENLKSVLSFMVLNNDNLNRLSDLRSLDEIRVIVDIISNKMLPTCGISGICNFLNRPLGIVVNIRDNASGCNSPEEVLFSCSELGKLSYTTFYDLNKNGIKESNELIVPNLPIEISPIGVTTISGNQNSAGHIFPEFGDYTATFIDNFDWELTTSGNFDFSLSESDRTAEVFFGVYPKNIYSNLVASINSPPLRCGSYITFDITVKNLGTDFGAGTVWFDVDERLTDFTHDADTVSTDWPNSIGWHFANLSPGHEFVKSVSIFIPIPPTIPVGEILKFKSYFKPIIRNGVPVIPDFVFSYCSEMRCAYDPNDKLVTPNRSADYQGTAYTKFEEDLIYTVRFQNTGNDAAYDVVIRDTLDANLDPSTFKIISSSHFEVLNVSIEEEHNVTFEFKDIFLPDSTTNFEASNGYVSYLIKTKDGLPEETPIQNTASIYFDFNPPIVTNTTENVMVTEFPTISSVNENQQLDIHLFPNPTDGKIYLSGVDLRDATISVYDLTGRLIQVEKSGTDEIVLPQSVSGMLFLKIETEEGTAVKRIFKN